MIRDQNSNLWLQYSTYPLLLLWPMNLWSRAAFLQEKIYI